MMLSLGICCPFLGKPNNSNIKRKCHVCLYCEENGNIPRLPFPMSYVRCLHVGMFPVMIQWKHHHMPFSEIYLNLFPGLKVIGFETGSRNTCCGKLPNAVHFKNINRWVKCSRNDCIACCLGSCNNVLPGQLHLYKIRNLIRGPFCDF